MIEISNLRKYTRGEVTRLEVDIKFIDMNAPCRAKTMYFEIRDDCGDMFSDDTYDAFVLAPLYFAMYNKTNLKICGNISKKFYKNLTWYIQKILCDFSDKLSPVNIFVEGFAPTVSKGYLTGAPLSCGVDSLSTIYDRFINENDPDYKINALFIFNNGTHGSFIDANTQRFFKSRVRRAVDAANDLHLPLIVVVDSNLHQFRNDENKNDLLFMALYSCVLSLQNSIRRYYIPAACNYQSMKEFGRKPHHYDLPIFCEAYLIPLIQTERTELIIDGCQYRRVDKVKNISDWDIAQKYLNVCLIQKGTDSTNCSECSKCQRTLLTLEILGKLEDFSKVFNLATYKKDSANYKVQCLLHTDDLFNNEQIELAQELNFPMPVKQNCYVLDKNIVLVKNE